MANSFAERSLCMYKLRFNQRGKPEDVFSIDDIDGVALNDLFLEFCDRSIEAGFLPAQSAHRHVSISAVHPSREGVLCHTRSGLSGEPFDVVDTNTSGVLKSYEEDKATMISARCFLPSGQLGKNGLLCVEHVIHGAGDTLVARAFRSFLHDSYPNIVMKFEPVIEKEVIDAFRSLEEVELRYYLEQNDVADTFLSEGDYLTYKVGHMRGRPFSLGVVDWIRSRGRRPVLVGVGGSIFDSEKTEVIFTLKDRHGRNRSFRLNDDLSVKFSEVLNPSGAPPLTDDSFVERCLESSERIMEKLGAEL